MLLIILFGFISFGKLFYYIVAKIRNNLICKKNFHAMLSVKYPIHNNNSEKKSQYKLKTEC